ncbi:MAG: hypothetical protein ACTSWV_02940 [Candidatus Asgardarchaeia archaeon]
MSDEKLEIKGEERGEVNKGTNPLSEEASETATMKVESKKLEEEKAVTEEDFEKKTLRTVLILIKDVLTLLDDLSRDVSEISRKLTQLSEKVENIRLGTTTSKLERNLQLISNILIADIARKLQQDFGSTIESGSDTVVNKKVAKKKEPVISEEELVKPSKLFSKKST